MASAVYRSGLLAAPPGTGHHSTPQPAGSHAAALDISCRIKQTGLWEGGGEQDGRGREGGGMGGEMVLMDARACNVDPQQHTKYHGDAYSHHCTFVISHACLSHTCP